MELEIIEGEPLNQEQEEYLKEQDFTGKVERYYAIKAQIKELEAKAEEEKGQMLLSMQLLKMSRAKVGELGVQWFRVTRKGKLDRNLLVEAGVDPKVLDRCTEEASTSVHFKVERVKEKSDA